MHGKDDDIGGDTLVVFQLNVVKVLVLHVFI